MGRPRLYNTPEEKANASRTWRQTYYQKNRDRISARAALRYQKKLLASGDKVAAIAARPVDTCTVTPETVPQSPGCGLSTSQQVQVLERSLYECLGQPLSCYFDNLYVDLITASANNDTLDSISNDLKRLEQVEMNTRAVEADALQACGIATLPTQLDEFSARLRDITKAVEELWCFAAMFSENTETALVHRGRTMPGGKKWSTPEQEQFLRERLPKYRDYGVSKNYAGFWAETNEAFFLRWPAQESAFPALEVPLVPTDANDARDVTPAIVLSAEQETLLAKHITTRKKQIQSWFRWQTNASRLARSSGTRSVLDKLEIYSHIYYDKHVKVDADAAIAEERITNRGPKLAKRKAVTKIKFAQEDDAVKAEVEEKYKEELAKYQKARERAASGEVEELDDSTKIKAFRELGPHLDRVFSYLSHMTGGMKFSVLAGGRDPTNEQKIVVMDYHIGETEAGSEFPACYPEFSRVQSAFLEFVHRSVAHDDVRRAEAASNISNSEDGSDDGSEEGEGPSAGAEFWQTERDGGEGCSEQPTLTNEGVVLLPGLESDALHTNAGGNAFPEGNGLLTTHSGAGNSTTSAATVELSAILDGSFPLDLDGFDFSSMSSGLVDSMMADLPPINGLRGDGFAGGPDDIQGDAVAANETTGLNTTFLADLFSDKIPDWMTMPPPFASSTTSLDSSSPACPSPSPTLLFPYTSAQPAPHSDPLPSTPPENPLSLSLTESVAASPVQHATDAPPVPQPQAIASAVVDPELQAHPPVVTNEPTVLRRGARQRAPSNRDEILNAIGGPTPRPRAPGKENRPPGQVNSRRKRGDDGDEEISQNIPLVFCCFVLSIAMILPLDNAVDYSALGRAVVDLKKILGFRIMPGDMVSIDQLQKQQAGPACFCCLVDRHLKMEHIRLVEIQNQIWAVAVIWIGTEPTTPRYRGEEERNEAGPIKIWGREIKVLCPKPDRSSMECADMAARK
ncbi:hypothetical protein BV22DRAFT_1051623 [Leucogyrophana mollusca]|uniref:Uncharacterized protein n=1 Tax=Leucogyrophana mollusca TaxID=85980 RepID=A0ACB8AZB5_9AGAM|nr:hypothetical protein BV22DRAFT_1051623 [Leucogyrophana mollusca]